MNEQDNKPERTAMQIAVENTKLEIAGYGLSSPMAVVLSDQIKMLEELRDTVEKEREERAATIIQALMDDMNGNGYHWLTSYKAAKVFIEKHTNHGK